MNPTPYVDLSPLAMLELCCWREARGEDGDTQRAQMWSIKNRVDHPCWWSESHDPMPSLWHAVILKPWQYSSFNLNDPNHIKWPSDVDPAFARIGQLAIPLTLGADTQDPTDGGTHYYDTSIAFPKAWGSESTWVNTLNSGRLRFWKMAPPTNHDEVQEAVTAT